LAKVSEFRYELPEAAIAQSSIEPRHDSRLLDTRSYTDHRFLDLPALLDPGDLVIVNETRVRAARLSGRRVGSGGQVELLLLDRDPEGRWEALARPARRLRPGVVIDLHETTATVIDNLGEGRILVNLDADDEEAVVQRIGTIPLPPYFTGELPDPSRYQTIFARTPGSAAAPTAGLHFTAEVMAGLSTRGIETARVDLHVSLDTFRPMTVEEVSDHLIHREWCAIPEETARSVAKTREKGKRVVAVGTTVVRTLESFAREDGTVEAGEAATDLFLQPGSDFRVVDGLVTNFHLPGSTLLVLLAGFMGPRWRRAYQVALDRGYRFLSFGDAMYAERAGT
jgi:S-adenosylmethionine:tRNA ribosyltransferase-isomerase